MKFLNTKTALGVVGARLDLNLIQCQALNKLHKKIEKELNGETRIPTSLALLLNELNDFLKLFENFPHPDETKDIWNNETEESKTSRDVAEEAVKMNRRFGRGVEAEVRKDESANAEDAWKDFDVTYKEDGELKSKVITARNEDEAATLFASRTNYKYVIELITKCKAVESKKN
jgi:hypothetical protein